MTADIQFWMGKLLQALEEPEHADGIIKTVLVEMASALKTGEQDSRATLLLREVLASPVNHQGLRTPRYRKGGEERVPVHYTAKRLSDDLLERIRATLRATEGRSSPPAPGSGGAVHYRTDGRIEPA